MKSVKSYKIIMLLSIMVYVSLGYHSIISSAKCNNVSLLIDKGFLCNECDGRLSIECNDENVHIVCDSCRYDEVFLEKSTNENAFNALIKSINKSTMEAQLYYDDLDLYQTECNTCHKQSIKGYLIPLLIQNEKDYIVITPTCGCYIEQDL